LGQLICVFLSPLFAYKTENRISYYGIAALGQFITNATKLVVNNQVIVFLIFAVPLPAEVQRAPVQCFRLSKNLSPPATNRIGGNGA
jgi:hypothetical protein